MREFGIIYVSSNRFRTNQRVATSLHNLDMPSNAIDGRSRDRGRE